MLGSRRLRCLLAQGRSSQGEQTTDSSRSRSWGKERIQSFTATMIHVTCVTVTAP